MSDIIIRICEGLAEVLIILYVTNIHGVSLATYGLLVAIHWKAAPETPFIAAGVVGMIGVIVFRLTVFRLTVDEQHAG